MRSAINRRFCALVVAAALLCCRGRAPAEQTASQQQLKQLIDSLMPGVSKATGLAFKSTPKSAIRTRDEIRGYLVKRMARELPASRLQGIRDTYRLLGMIPDSVDLARLFLDLYTEQIAGFYDPETRTLYAVQGADPATLRLVVAHELVHALQHEYLPLDSILRDDHDGDRQAAAQAVLEGQATLASIDMLLPDANVISSDEFWQSFRSRLRDQQFGATQFARAPMAIREQLVFPYVAGAEFMRWFARQHPGAQPYGGTMPQSTEQLMHPDRYEAHDAPLPVRLTGDSTGLEFEDTMGEFGIALLRAFLTHQQDVGQPPAMGWSGDRLRVFRTPDGPAMAWITVWDDADGVERFQRQITDSLSVHMRSGYQMRVVAPIHVGPNPAVLFYVAPKGWAGWKALPGATVAGS